MATFDIPALNLPLRRPVPPLPELPFLEAQRQLIEGRWGPLERFADVLPQALGDFEQSRARRLAGMLKKEEAQRARELFPLEKQKLQQEIETSKSLEEHRKARVKQFEQFQSLQKDPLFDMAVRNIMANPLAKFRLDNPDERVAAISEEVAILKAAKAGKTKLPGVTGPRPIPGSVRVRIKSTGQTGTIPAKDFNPNTMEKI